MCKTIEDEKEDKPDLAPELEREAHRLREQVKHILRKNKDKKIKPNMTQQEMAGKKKAYQDKDRVYLPADKGKVMEMLTCKRPASMMYKYTFYKSLENDTYLSVLLLNRIPNHPAPAIGGEL